MTFEKYLQSDLHHNSGNVETRNMLIVIFNTMDFLKANLLLIKLPEKFSLRILRSNFADHAILS